MKRLWLFVISAFVLLIAAWTSLIWIATKFPVQTVPVETNTQP